MLWIRRSISLSEIAAASCLALRVLSVFGVFAVPAAAQPAGTYPSTSPGRYVAMVSPTNGEAFVAPFNLRLVAIGHDDNVFTNQPVPGKGTNAAKVEFFLDDTKIYEQVGADAEYHVFKGYVTNLTAAPGQHIVWARATYTNVTPTMFLDSPVFTITVRDPPAYAQTVDLTADVVLSGSQSYQLTGTATGRVRLNGNGFRIRTTGSGTSGSLSLKFVDVYGLGNPADTSSPGIDVTTTGSAILEDSVFDSSNPTRLRMNGAAAASVRRNLFRSNMRPPIGQLPYPPSTVPLITFSGSSATPKTFAGNFVAAGPIWFEDANRWTIGWAVGAESSADTNVLIGARAAFELNDCANMTVRGNFVHHNYYGGWSQGQLLELHGTSPLLVEHNVLYDSSWPIRGIADEFRYNLVLEGGHEWVVPANNAYIHHNIFIGGDLDLGGITGHYNINARIENNTFDALRGRLVRSHITWHQGTTTVKSNAFTNVPTSGVGIVERDGGTIQADYNGFFNPETNNYVGVAAPAHDLNGGAQTNPNFAGPMPTKSFDMDEVAVWRRQLTVTQILAAYRARYTPVQGSAYIDAGDPAGGAGNDIGAVGAGVANAMDRFGKVGDSSGPGGGPGDPVDSDGDGLPDDWEVQFGLNPNSSTGDDGAGGNPDQDDANNLAEYERHSHPRNTAALTRYFAEGSQSAFFETTIDLVNPDATQDARVLLRFLTSGGTIVTRFVVVPARRHATVLASTVAGLAAADFSTIIETDHLVVSERTMVWTAEERYGSHTETATKAPSIDWFLAEGATHGVFSLFYLLENPTDAEANVRVRYLLPAPSAPIVRTYTVGAHARRTIPVDDEPGLGATDVSADIHSTNGVPIIVERAMYFSTDGISFRGGHGSAGVTEPKTNWFFAEGATGSFFNTFLLLANPDETRTAHVNVSYLLTDGSLIGVTHEMAPSSRQTYNVANEAPGLESAAVSALVSSDVPIVAERSMYWPQDWTEAHNAPGATETGTVWAVAGGEEGGAFNAQTYVLIANTSPFAGSARVTVLREDGPPLIHDVALQGNSRTNVPIGPTPEFAAVIGTRFGVLVESLGDTPAQLVVERASYSNGAAGIVWAAGGATLATRLQ